EAVSEPSPVAIGPSHFAYQGTEPWSIACGMRGGHLGFVPAAALRTPALVQYPVGHAHHDRRQLKHLMRMVRLEQGEHAVPTRTLLGPHLVHGRGCQKHLAMA